MFVATILVTVSDFLSNFMTKDLAMLDNHNILQHNKNIKSNF